PGGAPDPDGSLLTPASSEPEDSSRKLHLARLMNTIEEKQLEIAGSQYGIDADQGFLAGKKRILWGMPKEDVLLIFGDEIKGDTSGDVLTIEYGKRGAIEKVNLFFLNDIFYRVDTIYNIGPQEGMDILWTGIVERYGESTEAKEFRENEAARAARMAAIKNLCQPDKKTKKPTHAWNEQGVCTKCGALKTDVEPPPPPLEQHHTWEGDISLGVLTMVFTPNKALSKFTFSKKNPAIEADQNAKIEAEKKRRLEEERKKTLEEFKKPF
ncbi:MAG: hypothetical protein JW808_02160, partial [Victivallales bacterium]|nr:hypothetical protein [Victivallales bacterium]